MIDFVKYTAGQKLWAILLPSANSEIFLPVQIEIQNDPLRLIEMIPHYKIKILKYFEKSERAKQYFLESAIILAVANDEEISLKMRTKGYIKNKAIKGEFCRSGVLKKINTKDELDAYIGKKLFYINYYQIYDNFDEFQSAYNELIEMIIRKNLSIIKTYTNSLFYKGQFKCKRESDFVFRASKLWDSDIDFKEFKKQI
jgi:hypothetical protein